MRIFKSLEILVSDFAQNLEMGHFNAVRPKARGSEIPTIVLTEVPSYPSFQLRPGTHFDREVSSHSNLE